ncbi:F0F1-type ATP synthase, alpha subunit [Candidatus Scalindua japonica]|uniref:F0F1-type ATP synthase, alpha subunit n=2 Tax=Candidatus Scalindua japonica TaxID=1284222 RepID=A0A286U061_9BACT|nr:F0F1-type ATP synthase, alpha subunit [Candidatus Scalindua japonica]
MKCLLLFAISMVFLLSCARNSQAASITSIFDSDADGWFVQDVFQSTGNPGGTFSAGWSATGGNPGGHIFKDDPGPLAFFLAAPGKFIGNKSGSIGGTLSFDLSTSATSVGNVDSLIWLRGSGVILSYDASKQVETTFTSFTAPLDSSGNWTYYQDGLVNSRAATDADFNLVLSNLSALMIRGDYINGVERTSLDNVVMTGSTNPVPEPATVALIGIGIVGIAGAEARRRRKKRAVDNY